MNIKRPSKTNAIVSFEAKNQVPTSDFRLFYSVAAGKLAFYSRHRSHQNPALDPVPSVRAEIERRGFRVLAEGQRVAL